MYFLKCWYNGREYIERKNIVDQPTWLRNILDVAKVAGLIQQVKSPPPNFILWFTTDDTRNLIEFIGLERTS
jgi:hypothetical protein